MRGTIEAVEAFPDEAPYTRVTLKRPPLASAEPLVEAWFASGSSKTPLLVLGFGPPDKDPPLHSWFEPGDTDPPVHCRFAANIVSNRVAFRQIFFVDFEIRLA